MQIPVRQLPKKRKHPTPNKPSGPSPHGKAVGQSRAEEQRDFVPAFCFCYSSCKGDWRHFTYSLKKLEKTVIVIVDKGLFAMASFKLCGLCSKMVDEAMQPNPPLRTFLLQLLRLEEHQLPKKVCGECYQGAVDARKFTEQCERGLKKLHDGKMPEDMVLGFSKADTAPKKTEAKKGANKRHTIGGKPAPAQEFEEDTLVPRTSRSKAAQDKRSSRSSGLPAGLDDPLAITPKTSRSSRTPTTVATPKGKNAKGAASKNRSKSAGSGSRTFDVKIKKTDRSKAEQAAALGGRVVIAKRKTGWEIVKAAIETQASSQNSAKRPRPTSAVSTPPAKKTKSDLATDSTPAKAKDKDTISSFGRVRRSTKKGQDFDYIDVEDDDDIPLAPQPRDPYAAKATPRSRGALRTVADEPAHSTPPRSKAGPASAKKAGGVSVLKSQAGPASAQKKKKPVAAKRTGGMPASARKQSLPSSPASSDRSRSAKNKPGGFYYVDDDGPLDVEQPPSMAEPEIEMNNAELEEEEEEDDSQENFPSIGPYQCEICQQITDTKQQFVDHIKQNHLDVVDEEVLRSLESDLKKTTKKTKPSASAAQKNAMAKKKKQEEEARKKREKAREQEEARKKAMEARKKQEAQAAAAILAETSTNSPDSTSNADALGTESASTNVASNHWKASVARKYEQEASNASSTAAVEGSNLIQTTVVTVDPIQSPSKQVNTKGFMYIYRTSLY